MAPYTFIIVISKCHLHSWKIILICRVAMILTLALTIGHLELIIDKIKQKTIT